MRQPATTSRRRRGPPNRKTKRKIEAIDASGLTPLDYMLAVMRDTRAEPARRDEMAKAAAAYSHPQFAPTGADMARLLAQLLAEAVKSDASPAKRQA
jgi:hypothetical protein